MDDDVENMLVHYGVPGMRWGRRKSSSGSAGPKRKNDHEVRLERKKMVENRRKLSDDEINKAIDHEVRLERKKMVENRRKLSDDEINKAIDRISKEKKLKALVQEDLKPGRAVAKELLASNGKKVASAVIVGGGLYATKRLLVKRFNVSEETAAAITKRPK